MAKDKDKGFTTGEAAQLLRKEYEQLIEQNRKLEKKREDLEDELSDLCNKPLPRASMVQFLQRVCDINARRFEANFRQSGFYELANLYRYPSETATPIVLADVAPVLEGVPPLRQSSAGGVDGSRGIGAMLWPCYTAGNIGVARALCYFFGDVIKAKIPALVENMEWPGFESNETLEELEAQANNLAAQIDAVELELNQLAGALADMRSLFNA